MFFKKEDPTLVQKMQELTDILTQVDNERVKALELLTGEKAKTEAELQDSISKLTSDLKQLKSTRKIEEEDLAHMIKMKTERQELAYDRKVMDMEKTHQDYVAKLKVQHNAEMNERLKKESEQMMSMYKDVLSRLPNINASLKLKNGSGS